MKIALSLSFLAVGMLGTGCADPAVIATDISTTSDAGPDTSALDTTTEDAGADTSAEDASAGDTAEEDVGPDVADSPSFDWKSLAFDEVGPFGVGHRTRTVTYLPAGQTAERTITVHVWYPTTATEGEHPTYMGLFVDAISLDDAPLAEVAWSDRWPVVTNTHGHQGFAGNSVFLWRYFASHGWIAVIPDHTGNTLIDNIDPRPPWMYYVRSFDVTESLNALESDLFGFGLPANRLGTNRALLGGHSYGVHTGWATLGATFGKGAEFEAGPCAVCTPAELAAFAAGVHEPRLAAAVLMAGSMDRAWYGPEGHKTVTVPMLLMSGTKDPVGADVQFATTEGVDMTWIDITGACHQTFGLGPCDTLPEAEGTGMVAAWAMAFGRRHILGDDSLDAVLSGETPVAEGIAVKHHD